MQARANYRGSCALTGYHFEASPAASTVRMRTVYSGEPCFLRASKSVHGGDNTERAYGTVCHVHELMMHASPDRGRAPCDALSRFTAPSVLGLAAFFGAGFGLPNP